MAVVVERSTRIFSRLVFATSLLVVCCLVMLGADFFAIRSARSQLVVTSPSIDVSAVVRRELGMFFATNTPPPVVSEVSPRSSLPVFYVVELSTWETPSGSVRALVSGAECGVGDYCEYGLVLSIRPNRVICRSNDGLVILARRQTHVTPPTTGTTQAAPSSEESHGGLHPLG